MSRLMRSLYLLVFCFVLDAFTAEKGDLSLGVNIMLGGRYDNLRMCVATPAGVKGGPIADVMLVGRYHLNDRSAVGFKLPVMRPLLFGLAFGMLQFEPELTYEYRHTLSERTDLIVGPGIGISLHYGPYYTENKNDDAAQSFFAAGPFVSGLIGVAFTNDTGLERVVALKPFYAPLFSDRYRPGTVAGAALEGHLDFWESP